MDEPQDLAFGKERALKVKPGELILAGFVGGKNIAQPFVRFSRRDKLGCAEGVAGSVSSNSVQTAHGSRDVLEGVAKAVGEVVSRINFYDESAVVVHYRMSESNALHLSPVR